MRTTPIDVLTSKLERLRQREQERQKLDGPAEEDDDGGGYSFRSPLPAQTIAELEAQHGVTLPEDYKLFLTTIGDGGAGPSYYGTYGLADAFAESGKTIYGFADPFEPPQSTDDYVDEEAPGILLVGYQGCAYYDGLVLTGPEAGSMWAYVEVRPGWIPLPDSSGRLVGADGRPFQRTEDYGAWYNALLLPANRHLRISFTRWYEQWLDDLLEPPVVAGRG